MTNLRFVLMNGRTRVLPRTFYYPLTAGLAVPLGYRPLMIGELPQAGDLTWYAMDGWLIVEQRVIETVRRDKALSIDLVDWERWFYAVWLTRTVRRRLK